jgi:hypothetical protein
MMANTHMGQPSSSHVTLESIGVNSTGDTLQDLDFRRINPDGTAMPGPPWFRVPAGQVFVVTDVDWQYNSGSTGGVQIFRIFIENLASEPHYRERRRVFESTITLNNEGRGGISEAMTSGFIVSSKGRIVVDSYPGGEVISHIIIRGYLTEET